MFYSMVSGWMINYVVKSANGSLSKINTEQVANVFNKYRITDVIHLAAESHVDRSIKYPTVFFDTNVMGTLNLLNIAKEKWEGSDGERNVFINFSTDEIFGHLTSVDDKPFNETTPLSPRSPYATSKASQTMIGYTYYNTYNVPVINTTCGNIIGSHQFPEKLVPLTIDKIINNEKIRKINNKYYWS